MKQFWRKRHKAIFGFLVEGATVKLLSARATVQLLSASATVQLLSEGATEEMLANVVLQIAVQYCLNS